MNANVSSPAASSRTRRIASRRSVLTRSPEPFGIDPGATTRTSTPSAHAARASPKPVGPASYTASTSEPRPARNPTTSSGGIRSFTTLTSPVAGSTTAACVCAAWTSRPTSVLAFNAMVGSSYVVVGAARGATRTADLHPTLAWGTDHAYHHGRTATSIGSNREGNRDRYRTAVAGGASSAAIEKTRRDRCRPCSDARNRSFGPATG